MCNDIPRNRLHRKKFGELIVEELHRTPLHINYTPASRTFRGTRMCWKSQAFRFMKHETLKMNGFWGHESKNAESLFRFAKHARTGALKIWIDVH